MKMNKVSFFASIAKPIAVLSLTIPHSSNTWAQASLAKTPLSERGRSDLAAILTPSTDGLVRKENRPLFVQSAKTPAERVLSWNELAIELTAADHARGPTQGYDAFGPHRSSRAMAIVHIAMYDAVNSITRKYKTYSGVPDAPPEASVDLAIAVAAHDTLRNIFPLQKTRVEEALRVDRNRISQMIDTEITDPTANAFAKAEGTKAGAAAANAIWLLRQNDKSDLAEPDMGSEAEAQQMPDKFVFIPPQPGMYQVDPISKIRVAVGYHWGKVTPFVLQPAEIPQLRPVSPPVVTSKEYAEQYNEVRELGGDPQHNTLTTRKDFETFKGVFWAYDGTPELCAPPRLYNQIARQISEQNTKQNILEDVSAASRYLALINVAMADTAIVAWEAKWHYKYWRPVTAIRFADDGNDATVADPEFYPLGAPATNAKGPNFTPPFPAYPSGHASFGGALFGIMRAFWGERVSFELVSDEFNGLNVDPETGLRREFKSAQYVRMSDPEWENARSRIWLGIHWQVDADSGVTLGNAIAQRTLERAFLPR